MITVTATTKHGSSYVDVQVTEELYNFIASAQQAFEAATGLQPEGDNWEMTVHDAMHQLSGIGVSTSEERKLYFEVEKPIANGQQVEGIPAWVCSQLFEFYKSRGE